VDGFAAASPLRVMDGVQDRATGRNVTENERRCFPIA